MSVAFKRVARVNHPLGTTPNTALFSQPSRKVIASIFSFMAKICHLSHVHVNYLNHISRWPNILVLEKYVQCCTKRSKLEQTC